MPLITILVNNYNLLHRPVLIFQPTVNPKARDSGSKCVRTVLVSWEKDAVMASQLGKRCSYGKWRHTYQCLGGV